MTQKNIKHRKQLAPHISYDLDGDGAVSQRDYFIAKMFDKDQDGILNRKERSEALAALRDGLANDSMRDYFDSETMNNRRKKCTVFHSVMKSTVPQARLDLNDTFNRTLYHPVEIPDRNPYATTNQLMNMGEQGREMPEDLPKRSAFLLRRARQDRDFLKTKNRDMQTSIDNRVRNINDALKRRYTNNGPASSKFKSRSEFMTSRRQEMYRERLKHIAAKEGVDFHKDSGYVGDIGNIPHSLNYEGMPQKEVLERHPKEAYLQSKKNGKQVMDAKIKEKMFSTTRDRVLHLSRKGQRTRAFTSSAKDFFNSSHPGFEPEDHPLDRSLPIKPQYTAPHFHQMKPYPGKLTNTSLVTSHKYSHFDYVKIGRQLDTALQTQSIPPLAEMTQQ